jgi:hypothetical protein
MQGGLSLHGTLSHRATADAGTSERFPECASLVGCGALSTTAPLLSTRYATMAQKQSSIRSRPFFPYRPRGRAAPKGGVVSRPSRSA